MAETKSPGGAPPKAAAGPRHDPKVVIALRNFAISISVFNIVGYVVLGFEQPWLWPFFALATGYTLEIVLEAIGAKVEGRQPRFRGNGVRGLREFLYPAHITSLAMNMLLYVNDRLTVMLFGVCIAVGAKWVLRAPVRGRMRHYMNPSNFGIAIILLLFPWASIAPPYHFTERIGGPLDWLIPAIIVLGGSMLNGKLTNRMPLVMAWVSVFALQAVVRGLIFDTSIPGALAPMTGVAFVLYSNYMITDPGTSPSKRPAQMVFGGGVAALYAFFMIVHIAYGLFFATAAVCLIRGGFFWALHFVNKAAQQRQAQERAAAAAAEAEAEAIALAQDPTGESANAGKEVVPA
jgi:hypothetical protein